MQIPSGIKQWPVYALYGFILPFVCHVEIYNNLACFCGEAFDLGKRKLLVN